MSGAPSLDPVPARGVITEPDPANAAAQAVNSVGPRFGQVTLAPLNPPGTTEIAAIDDWPRRTAVYNACAGKYPVVHAAGEWWCKTANAIIPNNMHIIYEPGCIVTASLGKTGVPTNCIHYARMEPWASLNVPTTTVKTTTTRGTRVVNVVSNVGLTVGGLCFIGTWNSLRYAIRTIKSLVADGTGGYNLTIADNDPAIYWIIASGESVTAVTSRPSNIIIEGNGVLIRGASVGFDRAVELWGGYRCKVTGLRIDGTNGADVACSMDGGSTECEYQGIWIDGGGGSLGGYWCEMGERNRFLDCHSHNTASNGLVMHASVHCEAHGCSASKAVYYGALITAWLPGPHYQSIGCKIVGGSFRENAIGVYEDTRTADFELVGVDASYNSQYGVYLASGTASEPTTIKATSLHLEANTLGGVYQGAYSIAQLRQIRAPNSYGYAVGFGGDHATMFLDGLEMTFQASAGFKQGILNSASTSPCWIANVKIAMAGATDLSSGIYWATGVAHLDHVLIDGSGSGGGGYYGINVLVPGAIWVGDDLDPSNCAAPWNGGSMAGRASRGTLTLGGGTGVGSLSFAPTTARSSCRLTRVTLGAAPGELSYTLSAGVGVTVQSSNAADTGIVLVEINPVGAL